MQLFHVLNRGVDKRKLFLDKQDYLRFVHDLFEFNDAELINNNKYYFSKSKIKDIVSPYIGSNKSKKKPRKLLVDIYAFCLMPNHYHLLLSPKVESGISLFMKKVNIGYAKYFNQKYERQGTLFEGRYKSISIDNESHFIHIPYYIHLNPLDLIAPEWRERKLKNYKKAINFLNSYRWSSHLDYIGKTNFPSVTNRDFLMEFFGGPEKYRKSINDWLKNLNLMNFKEFLLE
ncbi:MAG: transposase [Minisyncoccia bacterium]